MGVCWLVPAIASLLKAPYLTIAAWVIFLLTLITARWVEIDKPKRKPTLMPDVLTVSEAARYLKVEEIDVRHLIEDGELQAKAVGGDYRISSAALQNYLDS
jgi:excisionase family DNA binding protein